MTTLTVDQVEELEAATRAGLATAIANLTQLREGEAHRVRGFATWHEYVLDRFGDLLRELHLPKPERQALVASMAEAGKSVRESAGELAVSKSTVQNDRRELGIGGKVVNLDDHRPAAESAGIQSTPAAAERENSQESAAPSPSSIDLVVAAVARVQARTGDGLMVHEAARRLHWRQGQTSCALSRAEKRGRLVRSGRFRGGCAVYVLPAVEAAAVA